MDIAALMNSTHFAHSQQVAKISSILAQLAGYTAEETEVICQAALFHDIIEDTKYGAKEIEMAFGARVAGLVQAESENKRRGQDASATWKIRKQEFIDSLADKSKEGKVIALADKLSNMRATYQGCRKNGEEFWERFHEKRKEMHAWYYRSITDGLREFENTDAWKELDGLVRKVFYEEKM